MASWQNGYKVYSPWKIFKQTILIRDNCEQTESKETLLCRSIIQKA